MEVTRSESGHNAQSKATLKSKILYALDSCHYYQSFGLGFTPFMF